MLQVIYDNATVEDKTHWVGDYRDALEACIGIPSERSCIDVVLVSY